MSYTVLVVSHGHPAITPGWCENAAYALHRAFRPVQAGRACFLQLLLHSSVPVKTLNPLAPVAMNGC